MGLELWQHGRLVYWKSQSAFQSGASPKGHLVLLSIAKITWSREEAPRNVVVKHLDNREAFELVLCFPSEKAAQDWSIALKQMRTLVGGQTPGQAQGRLSVARPSGQFRMSAFEVR